jgi:hypothetical protein
LVLGIIDIQVPSVAAKIPSYAISKEEYTIWFFLAPKSSSPDSVFLSLPVDSGR